MMVSQLSKIGGMPVEGAVFCPRSGPGRATSTRSTGPPCCARPCLLALQWLVPLALGPLVVVVLGAVVVTVFSLQDQGIAEVGAVLAGLPVPRLPRASL